MRCDQMWAVTVSAVALVGCSGPATTADQLVDMQFTAFVDADGNGLSADDAPTTLHLADYLAAQRPGTRMLMLNAAAGWCDPCQREAAALPQFRAEYEPAEDAILPAVVLEATGTIRKAAEATFRAQAPDTSAAAEAPFELEPPDQRHGDDTLANEIAIRSTAIPPAIPPVIPPTRDAYAAAPPPPVSAQPKIDADVPRPVEWEELEELEGLIAAQGSRQPWWSWP